MLRKDILIIYLLVYKSRCFNHKSVILAIMIDFMQISIYTYWYLYCLGADNDDEIRHFQLGSYPGFILSQEIKRSF
jgi:hypothetical protein